MWFWGISRGGRRRHKREEKERNGRYVVARSESDLFMRHEGGSRERMVGCTGMKQAITWADVKSEGFFFLVGEEFIGLKNELNLNLIF